MENISPSIILIWDALRALESGQSVSVGIQKYLKRFHQTKEKDQFYYQIETWWSSKLNPKISFDVNKLNHTRRELVIILEQGLAGESILSTLRSLEEELLMSCEDEIQQHLSLLPLKMMFPLFGLIFPSMLVVLVFPLLRLLSF